MNEFLISVRLLLRDWRSGELTVLVISLLIAVSSMTTVGFFADRVKSALENQAEKLLGADLVISSDHPLDAVFESEAEKRGLSTTAAVKFPSMVGSNDSSVLSEINAVRAGYPLRGQLRLSNGAGGIPKPGMIWADRKLTTRLNLAPGSKVAIGEAYFTLDAVVEDEPGAAFSFLSLGPGLIMNEADLSSTKLIQAGSRIRYFFYAAGDAGSISPYREWAKSRLERGQRMEDANGGSPEIKAMLDRSEIFLRMASLLSVVLASAAIALSARRFVERHLDGCAVMRVMGATKATLLRLHLYQFSMQGWASCLAGAALGFAAQDLIAMEFSNISGVELPPPTLVPAIQGCAAGMLLFFGFALPPILALAKVPALQVMRREMPSPRTGYALGLAALAALFLWQADGVKPGAILFAGFGFMVAVSALVARLFLVRMKSGGTGWRYGLASLRRRSTASVVQIVAFGLGLTAILTLTLVRGDLFESWRQSLPKDAPNIFVLNIQPGELKAVSRFLAQAGKPEFFPMVRGRLNRINDRSISSESYSELRAKRLVDREFNLSWSKKPLSENWKRGEPVFSVEEGLAKTLSIRMGDTLTFEVAGSAVSGRVVSLRKVDWNSFRVNFFVLTPPGLLDDFPASYITSFHLPPGNAQLMNGLSRNFPSLLIVDVSAVLEKMQKMMNQAAAAVEFVFIYSLAAGAMVLAAAFRSTQDERMREAAILRTLGASRRQVLTANAAEFLILGGFSGMFAAIGATGIGYLASRKLLDLPFSFDPEVALAGIAMGIFCILSMGLLWTRKALAMPPLPALRA